MFVGILGFEFKSKFIEILKFIFYGLFYLDLSYIYIFDGEDLFRGLLEIFVIVVIGMFIVLIICIFFVFLGVKNMMKLWLVMGISKFILSIICVFFEIVMVLIFIKVVGLGLFLGVFVFGIYLVGMLGKFFVEDIESLDFSVVEFLKVSGVNKMKMLMFVVIL